jgi:hypothetical protein
MSYVVFVTYWCAGGSFMLKKEERKRSITHCVIGKRREKVKWRKELREG